MPRYRFTPNDLQPLRKLLGGIDVQPLANQVVPVKRFTPERRVLEPVPEKLPVEVLGRDHPDGVPLAKLAELVQQRVPGARSVVVRGGRMHVVYDGPPSERARAQLRGLVADRAAFEQLKVRPGRIEPSEPELEKRLLRSELSDSEWLATFRRVEAARLARAGTGGTGGELPQPTITGPVRTAQPPSSSPARAAQPSRPRKKGRS